MGFRVHILAICLSGLWNGAADAGNLLLKPGFESGDTRGWTAWGCGLGAVGRVTSRIRPAAGWIVSGV